MTTAELTTILQSVQTRHDQYKARLNTLLRLIHDIEADTIFKDQDPLSHEELVDEATTVHFEYTKHLHLYNPITKLLKATLKDGNTETPAYYALLVEHHACLMAFTATHVAQIEEYTILLEEAYELHIEHLS